jgi:hypothetical protein
MKTVLAFKLTTVAFGTTENVWCSIAIVTLKSSWRFCPTDDDLRSLPVSYGWCQATSSGVVCQQGSFPSAD